MYFKIVDSGMNCLMMIFIVIQSVNSVLPPPKKLHRVVAGFYSFHPVYDNDKPAAIASTKNYVYKNPYKNNIEHHHFHYTPTHHHYENDMKLNNLVKNAQIIKGKHRNMPNKYSLNGRKATRWEYSQYVYGVSQLFQHYLTLARQLALHYGHKYHYEPNLLYVSIISIHTNTLIPVRFLTHKYPAISFFTFSPSFFCKKKLFFLLKGFLKICLFFTLFC